MGTDPFLGVFLHALGGLAAGSFYIPFKGVKGWRWETYWLLGGLFSWIIAPWVVSLLTVPGTLEILKAAPRDVLMRSYVFGVLWGIGGLTFGLSMRYLGVSLGYAIALGFCAAFGTLVPPLFDGTFVQMFSTKAGMVLLAGIGLCLVGIAICGQAGVRKERELPDAEKREAIREFDFWKGVWVAIFAGVMSACMSYGISAGKPINDLAIAKGAPSLWQTGPTLIVVLAGGFTTNLIWCLFLHLKNRSGRDYVAAADGGSIGLNYVLSAIAGVTWYFQFMFYGMGSSRLPESFKFSSWTLHMAFIIIFSNLWGFAFHEWRGSGSRTRQTIIGGLIALVISTIVIGYGNSLGQP
ncbi:MAG: L-rhamnose/proton symporter RhaT [Candidatus Sumerlaeaceae bacterium]